MDHKEVKNKEKKNSNLTSKKKLTLDQRRANLLASKAPGEKATHHFNKHIAAYCEDTDCAIVFENIAFWIDYNARHKQNHAYDRYWTYMTREAMCEDQDYHSMDQLKRIVSKLIDLDLIIVEQRERHLCKRRNWYALSDLAISFIGKDKHKKPNLRDIHNQHNQQIEANQMFENPAPMISPKIEINQFSSKNLIPIDKAISPVENSTLDRIPIDKAISPDEPRSGDIAPSHTDIKTDIKRTTGDLVTSVVYSTNNVKHMSQVCDSVSLNCKDEKSMQPNTKEQFDYTEELYSLDFSSSQVKELEGLYINNMELLILSIKRLSFDVIHNQRNKKLNPGSTIQRFFMKIMCKLQGYGAPKGWKDNGKVSSIVPGLYHPSYKPVDRAIFKADREETIRNKEKGKPIIENVLKSVREKASQVSISGKAIE